MADQKKFQFSDPVSGADLELSLGLSKVDDDRKGWEYYCCIPWNVQPCMMPYWPPPPPPLVPVFCDQFSTSIPYTGGMSTGSSSNSKDSDARSNRQVNFMADFGENKMKLMESFGKNPCVVTTGDGSQGKQVTGFLTKYDTEEDIRIVCNCHGQCFSPAGFVMHAGGSCVSYPLRKIIVLPSSSPSPPP